MSQHVYDSEDGEFVDFATLDDWRETDRKKDAEIVKLREALEELADICSGCLFETIRIRGQYVSRKEAVSRAREALEQNKTET
jgi:hypothetical protein